MMRVKVQKTKADRKGIMISFRGVNCQEGPCEPLVKTGNKSSKCPGSPRHRRLQFPGASALGVCRIQECQGWGHLKGLTKPIRLTNRETEAQRRGSLAPDPIIGHQTLDMKILPLYLDHCPQRGIFKLQNALYL